MAGRNVEVVEQLPNGRVILKIERKIAFQNKSKKITKYAIGDKDEIVNTLDQNGEMTDILFFDNYKLNEMGDIIIGIKKDGDEYYKRVLSRFDLSDTEVQVTEVPGGPFNLGPYEKSYYEYEMPTKKIEDIIPKSYSFNYGLINRNGILVIYPVYDEIHFGTENTCILGVLNSLAYLKYGYNDLISGRPITPICFYEAKDFCNERALVKYNHKYGYVDRNKVMTNPNNLNEYAENLAPKFWGATSFLDGIATVIISKGNHFEPSRRVKVDTTGNIVEFIPIPSALRRRKL